MEDDSKEAWLKRYEQRQKVASLRLAASVRFETEEVPDSMTLEEYTAEYIREQGKPFGGGPMRHLIRELRL